MLLHDLSLLVGFRQTKFTVTFTRPEEKALEMRVLCYELICFRVQFYGFLKKALPSREEPDISLSIMVYFHPKVW